jgi:hypothetical protein
LICAFATKANREGLRFKVGWLQLLTVAIRCTLLPDRHDCKELEVYRFLTAVAVHWPKRWNDSAFGHPAPPLSRLWAIETGPNAGFPAQRKTAMHWFTSCARRSPVP